MKSFVLVLGLSMFLGACGHMGGHKKGADGKASCCAEKEMDCCKEAKEKGQSCDRC